jgi:hypothetical protein
MVFSNIVHFQKSKKYQCVEKVDGEDVVVARTQDLGLAKGKRVRGLSTSTSPRFSLVHRSQERYHPLTASFERLSRSWSVFARFAAVQRTEIVNRFARCETLSGDDMTTGIKYIC